MAVTAPHPAVLATLAGQVVDPIPVDLTAGSWTCPRCAGILLVPLGATDPDEYVAKVLDHECPTPTPGDPTWERRP